MADTSTLTVGEMRFLRSKKGKTKSKRIRNEKIREFKDKHLGKQINK
jgi:hypothetical protein